MQSVVRTAVVLPALLGLALPAAADEPRKEPPGTVEVRCTDNSTLKLTLKDERLEVITRYGKLTVPIADVRKIEFGTRVADDLVPKIDAAISNLGSPSYKAREAATAELLAFKAQAFPALMKASKHKDPEVVRRAEDLMGRIRELVPADQLEIREFDVVHTEDMKVTGKITLTTFRVTTVQFGEQLLKLADLRGLRTPGTVDVETEPVNVLTDPGQLANLQGQVGKTFFFRVTGAANGSVWGTDTYTSDSTLAVAAVHAGLLRPGQTGVVKVTIVPPPLAFQGSTRHGVTSSAYGPYPGAYKLGK